MRMFIDSYTGRRKTATEQAMRILRVPLALLLLLPLAARASARQRARHSNPAKRRHSRNICVASYRMSRAENLAYIYFTER